jgi:hypothetical protein
MHPSFVKATQDVATTVAQERELSARYIAELASGCISAYRNAKMPALL